MGATVKALLAFGERAPLLVAHEQHPHPVDPGEAGPDGTVIAECAIAVQFDEFFEDQVEVIECLRAIGMARHEHGFPRCQTRVPRFFERGQFLAEAFDVVAIPGGCFELRQRFFERVDVVFKRQRNRNHHQTFQ